MYHEEKIIDGVLCRRNHPDGAFVAYTLKQLTAKVAEAERRLNTTRERLNTAREMLHRL